MNNEYFEEETSRVPSGIIAMVMGRVSNAFLPNSSDRFPISGVITIAPNPMICMTFEKVLYFAQEYIPWQMGRKRGLTKH